jgi:ATP/ADP translocase
MDECREGSKRATTSQLFNLITILFCGCYALVMFPNPLFLPENE